MKIIDEAVSKSDIVTRAINDTTYSSFEFSTGFIIAIVAIIIILIALWIYLKTWGLA